MTNWFISFSIKYINKEAKQRIVGIITLIVVPFLNWIGTFPDIPFLIVLSICLILGVISLFVPKLFPVGKAFVITTISLMLFVVIKNSIKEPQTDNMEYIMTCDDVVHKTISISDSTGWKLYQERNPEILAWIGCVILEGCLKENDLRYKIPMLKYADSLLNEARKADVAYAYFGRAYKEFHGLGCEKSIKEAVRDAQTSLNMEEFPQAYSLLEEMNLDSTEYPEVVNRVRLWRDSIDNVNINSYTDLYQTFFPELSNNKQRNIIISTRTKFNNHGLNTTSIQSDSPEHNSIIKRMNALYEALYNGDTTSVAWKAIERNIEFIKSSKREFANILAAYYWGKKDVDSAHLYCDSIYGFYGILNQLHDFNKIPLNRENIDKDIVRNLNDVLHYSSIDKLNYYSFLSDDPLLKHVLNAAYKRRNHCISQKKQSEGRSSLEKNK